MVMTKRNMGIMPALLNELMDWSNYATEDRNEMPKMNVSESEKEYVVEMCVPGHSKEELSLSMDSENNLVVELAATKKEEENNALHYLRHEFGRLQFKQTLSIPENVKKESIGAQMENGVLTIVLPKFTEQEKEALKQKIEIK